MYRRFGIGGCSNRATTTTGIGWPIAVSDMEKVATAGPVINHAMHHGLEVHAELQRGMGMQIVAPYVVNEIINSLLLCYKQKCAIWVTRRLL